jgi:cell volume regulation protein A
MSWPERAFVVWGDLKGAVPILLAAFTLMAAVDDAPRIYGIVFVVVAFSVFVKGGSIFFVARRLGIRMRRRPRSPWRITVGLTEEPDDVQRHVVRKGSPAAATSVRDLALPESAWISLVVREGRARQPRGEEVLEPGDEVIALADPEDEPALRALFGGA